MYFRSLSLLTTAEMGHVVHRHGQARVVQQHLLQYVLRAILYEDYDEDEETFGQALGELLLKSARWFGEQRFSRRDEYQADATSWEILSDSGRYNPQSLRSLLQKLQALEETGGGGTGRKGGGQDPLFARKAMEWSRTHPATGERIVALQRKWDELPAKERRRLSRIPI